MQAPSHVSVAVLLLLAAILTGTSIAEEPKGYIEHGQAEHGLRLSISWDKENYFSSEPIVIKLILRNVSTEPKEYSTSGDRFTYEIFIIDQNKKRVPLTTMAYRKVGRVSFRTEFLKPGVEHTDSVQINEDWDLSSPGTYLVYAKRRVVDTNVPSNMGTVVSGNAIIRIVADGTNQTTNSAASGVSSTASAISPTTPRAKGTPPVVASKQSATAAPSVASSTDGTAGDSAAYKDASPAKVDTASKTLATGSGLQPRDWFFGAFLLAVLVFVGVILLRARARSKP